MNYNALLAGINRPYEEHFQKFKRQLWKFFSLTRWVSVEAVGLYFLICMKKLNEIVKIKFNEYL